MGKYRKKYGWQAARARNNWRRKYLALRKRGYSKRGAKFWASSSSRWIPGYHKGY